MLMAHQLYAFKDDGARFAMSAAHQLDAFSFESCSFFSMNIQCTSESSRSVH